MPACMNRPHRVGPGPEGRPRVKGARLPTLNERVADPATAWQRVDDPGLVWQDAASA